MSSFLSTPQPARSPSPRARATQLTHLIFARPDLDVAAEFLVELGLMVVKRSEAVLYARAADPSEYVYRVERGDTPRFVGFGLAVETARELEALARLDGASQVRPIAHPGGGMGVTLRDPCGFIVEVVHARACAAALEQRPSLEWNGSETRRINATQRPDVAPHLVSRLGHVVLETARFQELCGFYTRELGLLPSDVLVLSDGSPAVVFLRLDRGNTPADHHTIAIAQSIRDGLGHCAFEMVDLDAIGMGQRMLREAGYQHAWGIGRHILGSQIFDYWRDPWGAKHEHYCDGDVLTAEVPMGIHKASRAAMAQWGPAMPRSFTAPGVTLENLAALVRNLRTTPDLSIGKLIQLGRIFG